MADFMGIKGTVNALQNQKKRRQRALNAAQQARQGKPVGGDPSMARKKVNTNMEDMMRKIRDAHPPVKRAVRKNTILGTPAKTGGLRQSAPPPTKAMSDLQKRIEALQGSMADSKKEKLKSSRMAMQERRRRAAGVLK